MNDVRQPLLLEVRGIGKIHGPGCPHCIATTGPAAETNLCRHCGAVVAAHDISFDLRRGEILGVMGESGSGKSTLVRLLCFDEAPSGGQARFHESDKTHELFTLNAAQKQWLRNRRFGMVYQNPNLGLNFKVSSGANIAERLLMSDVTSFAAIRARAADLLQRTEVPVGRMDEKPGRFSGGMQQRLQIAKALATNPPLLFLDEVTTGLDLSVQARILDLIQEIQRESQAAMIVVTHDLGVVRLLASRTIIMKHGRIVESGLTDQILEDPQHAYTQQLVAAAL
jgi:putative phosphonate transport system ATP-binding protein